MHRTTIRLKVNGETVERWVEDRLLLVDFLRDHLGLTGTHIGCEHGVCGACTVLVDGKTVRSCLMFAVQADGCEIETVESLAQNGQLHPLQQAFLDHHGFQCGYCTPGILMVAKELLEKSPQPTEEEVRIALAGNICRCTGYQQIVEAVLAAAQQMKRGV